MLTRKGISFSLPALVAVLVGSGYMPVVNVKNNGASLIYCLNTVLFTCMH